MTTHDADGTGTGASRTAAVRRFGPLLLAVLAFLVFRAVTFDDGTRDLAAGQCVTASDADEVLPRYANTHTESSGTGLQTTRLREDARRTIRDAVGGDDETVVVFVQRNAFTDDASVRRLCAEHGSARAFTSALSQGGTGTVVCVVAGP